ncbi:uncharacterized protein PFL1_05948 [Pseudozyma flocculosa PF-1]|uniref:Uncharacterized protein n=1 Tax=Pseudozyma flocculosa PF-1 TaxID=1277687 RepID=A0A061H1U5_9BASI|nr:uncharacterized protein PFL1_05948 [Pseudozyma flocculosa PF-1]EPQ26627.1 hypothetical protein PFL1_05948 [Pseudozyma flocculosa PF-1]
MRVGLHQRRSACLRTAAFVLSTAVTLNLLTSTTLATPPVRPGFDGLGRLAEATAAGEAVADEAATFPRYEYLTPIHPDWRAEHVQYDFTPAESLRAGDSVTLILYRDHLFPGPQADEGASAANEEGAVPIFDSGGSVVPQSTSRERAEPSGAVDEIRPLSAPQKQELLARGARLLRETSERLGRSKVFGLGNDELRAWLTRIYRIRQRSSGIMQDEGPWGWKMYDALDIEVLPADRTKPQILRFLQSYRTREGPRLRNHPLDEDETGPFDGAPWPFQDFAVGGFRVRVLPGRMGVETFRNRPMDEDHPVVAYRQRQPSDGPDAPAGSRESSLLEWVFVGNVKVTRRPLPPAPSSPEPGQL